MPQAIETFQDGLAALLHHIVDLNLASDLTPEDIEFVQALESAVTQRLRKPAIESLAQAGINPAAIQQGADPMSGMPSTGPMNGPTPGPTPGPALSPSMGGVMPSPAVNADELRRMLSSG